MGGSYEYGKIPISFDFNGEFIDDENVFRYPWHAKALAITLASGFLGKWTLDESRHARECLTPKDYKNFSYYERWLASLINLLVAKIVLVGFVTACLLAGVPTNLSSPNDTTEGVVLLPSVFSITLAPLPSITETQEFVVPKSIPIILLIFSPLRLYI